MSGWRGITLWVTCSKGTARMLELAGDKQGTISGTRFIPTAIPGDAPNLSTVHEHPADNEKISCFRQL